MGEPIAMPSMIRAADIGGIKDLLSSLGYPLLPDREQTLDIDTLLQRKDLREKVKSIRKLTSISGEWRHPISKQSFRKDAVIILIELLEDAMVKKQLAFEITRYISIHGPPTEQGLFVFIAPKSRTFAVTAYTPVLSQTDQIIVRRLLVDVDNITRTDADALSELDGLANNSKTIVQNFIDALPYKKVGNEFFSNYHDIFESMSKRMAEIFDKQDELYDYTQRFLGRIVFLYFLQRKEWLDKNKKYLRKAREGLDGEKQFDMLYQIFDKLNSEKRDDTKVIPFLNGSLFEREDFDKEKMDKIRKANAPIISTIMDHFDEFNFTVSESTPLDKEVAVDPELLGNIFESMLPESERGDKGTFYTHQEEMVFMAKEGIRSYLERFPDLLTKEQVFQLVYDYSPSAKEGLNIKPKDAREIRDKLRAIKILDPAVGSGGFLLASLQVLMDIRKKLNGVIGTVESEYDMKLEFIEHCLFGVDIEAEAIELSRLRLWLTLIVDERAENVRTLPNLDYNLYRGDSLKVTDKDKHVRLETIEERKALVSYIKELRGKFIPSHGQEKDKISNDLSKALRKLIQLDTGRKLSPDDVIPFSFKNIFSDIMEGGGFDVVLMNPPYIRQEEIGRLPGQDPRTYKTEIISESIESTKGQFKPNKKSDISTYFHVRALSLLKKDGVAVVIASSKWLDVGYGAPLQEYLLKNTAIDIIYESQDRSFAAQVNVIISVIRKLIQNTASNKVRFAFIKRPYSEISAKMIVNILDSHEWLESDLYRLRNRTQMELLRDGQSTFNNTNAINSNGAIPLSIDDTEDDKEKTNKKQKKPIKKKFKELSYIGSKWGNVWLRAPDVYFKIIKENLNNFQRLRDVVELKYGDKTGCVHYFIINILSDKGKIVLCKNGMGYEFELEKEFCIPILKDPEDVGKCVDLKCIPSYRFYCTIPRSKLKGTRALNYIEWAEKSHDSLVPVRRGSKKGELSRINELASVGGGGDWYIPKDVTPAHICLPLLVKNRPLIPYSETPLICTNNFYAVISNEPIDSWIYLNSMVFRMFIELYGRIEAPALQISKAEYELCPIIKSIKNISEDYSLLDTFKKRDAYRLVNIVEEGPLELIQVDRIELDNIVLKAMGYEQAEKRNIILNEIYRWVQNETQWRVEKPAKAPISKTKKSKTNASKGLQTKLNL